MSKPTGETTATIMEKLQRSPFENIVVRVGTTRYLIPSATIKLLAWKSIPDAIKDEHSAEAKKYATLRTGMKALIRPFMPEILRKSWGSDVEIEPRLNILSWLPGYFVHLLVNLVASKGWVINVENCESCGGDIYKIVGISPDTNIVDNSPALPAASADNQPVQGRGQQDAYRAADRDELRGSVGSSGGETKR
jgi:hypothetical protein